jgi:hypothetical protein
MRPTHRRFAQLHVAEADHPRDQTYTGAVRATGANKTNLLTRVASAAIPDVPEGTATFHPRAPEPHRSAVDGLAHLLVDGDGRLGAKPATVETAPSRVRMVGATGTNAIAIHG